MNVQKLLMQIVCHNQGLVSRRWLDHGLKKRIEQAHHNLLLYCHKEYVSRTYFLKFPIQLIINLDLVVNMDLDPCNQHKYQVKRLDVIQQILLKIVFQHPRKIRHQMLLAQDNLRDHASII